MDTWRLATVGLALVMLACTHDAGDEPGPGGESDPRAVSPDVSATPSPAPSLPASAARGRIVASDDDIFFLNLPIGSIRGLTRLEGDQFDADAVGQLVVYRDSSRGVNVDDEIWVLDTRTRRARNLTEAPDSNEWGPAWSPDGTRIAFSSDRDGIPQVYVMAADGSNLRRLSDVWGEYPSWSPDGSTIAFESYVGGTTPFGDPDYDVFVMDADGRRERNITNDPESYDGYPTWSPDGGRIAFQSTRGTPRDFKPPSYDLERTSDEDIWLMDPDGAHATNLTNDLTRQDSFPDWAPGRLVVYTREGAIVLLDPATGAQFDVTAEAEAPLERFSGGFPAWWDRSAPLTGSRSSPW